MKSNTALRVVDNNSYASKDFTIQASGKMFHMVISGLYSDKPKSITREIWSNAYDAHAMVGKQDVPFEVTFPTPLTPTFVCRDFGPGIAHEDMEGFYTVLGHSTKEGTNKAVGKWGVGRMSPMSYTDTFSVVSRHKGMIAYYSVQLGPDGSPQLHVLAPPSPTDGADGLEVSFPVNRFDIPDFQRAAELVSYGFNPQPVVTNSKEKSFVPLKSPFSGDGYYLYEDSRMSGAYAQMGCVLYPIPGVYLPRMINIVYQFAIGDLEVTASREALSFGPNDPTEANIKTKAAEVERHLWQKVQDSINSQPSLFEGTRADTKINKWLSPNRAKFTYRGVDIPKFWDLSPYKNIGISCGYRSYRQSMAGWSLEKSLGVMQDYTIFVQDMSDKKGCARPGRRIFERVKTYGWYVWVRVNLSNPVEKAELDLLTKEIKYPVVYIKDIPDPGGYTRSRSKVKVSVIQGTQRKPHDMDDAEFTKGGYYYPMSNNEFPEVFKYLQGLVKTAFGQDHLVLVPKTLWKKFESAPQWKHFEPALNNLVRKEAPNVVSTFGDRYKRYPLNSLAAFADMKGSVGEFARKVRDEVTVDHYLDTNSPAWARLLQQLNLTVPNNDKSEAEYKKLLDEYPLLALYEPHQSTKIVNGFKSYIAAKE
jgi:hypothetical protein